MDINAVQLFAHRGGRDWGPENTLSVFKKSLELGVDGIELDIQRCASGELVVFHDADLSRTTNGAGLLKDCSFDELRRLSAGRWYSPEFQDEKIPTLEEVLRLVDGGATINIEIKNLPVPYEGIEEDLVSIMDNYKFMDRIIFSSFDHRVMAKMYKLRPDWQYAVLMIGIPDSISDYVQSLNAKYWHPQYKCVDSDSISEALKADIKINPWTVNDERGWSSMLEYGASGIITDNPEKLKEFLDKIKALVKT